MKWFVTLSAGALMWTAAHAWAADGLDAIAGKALFERLWVPAPASTNASDGLGPLFNGRGCISCHADGGGARLVERADGTRTLAGAVVRFGTKDGAPDPVLGLQLQTAAVPGLAAEGTAAFLPKLSFNLDVGRLADGVRAGARVAPSLFDRAVFETIPDGEILRYADANDRDNDGISGRVHRLADGRVGRSGWKAMHATLEDQIAHALVLDIGLSSPRQPYPYGDCTVAQTECRSAPIGESAAFDGREVSNQIVALMRGYLATLKSPEERDDAPGQKLFGETGCARCHFPSVTARDGARVEAFTDFLLHDMGADLDDGVGEPGVASSEWRTAPLKRGAMPASGRRYLHDGSAATVTEAVTKHGGEASASRDKFQGLKEGDRQRLIRYVENL